MLIDESLLQCGRFTQAGRGVWESPRLAIECAECGQVTGQRAAE